MKPSDADRTKARELMDMEMLFTLAASETAIAQALADACADGIREAAAITVPLTYSTMVEHAILALLDDKSDPMLPRCRCGMFRQVCACGYDKKETTT